MLRLRLPVVSCLFPARRVVAVRIPIVTLPLIGAGAGLLAASAFGLVGVGLWLLFGGPPEAALPMAAWVLTCGAASGSLLGFCLAIDRWMSKDPAEQQGRSDTPRRA
jgi:hypothetical protein